MTNWTKMWPKKESKKLGAKTWAHGNASGPQIKSLECNLSWRHRGKNLLFSWEKFFLSVSLFFSHKTWIYDFISNHPWGHLLTVDSHCFFAFSCHLMYYTMCNIILSKILSPHTHLQPIAAIFGQVKNIIWCFPVIHLAKWQEFARFSTFCLMGVSLPALFPYHLIKKTLTKQF